MNNKLVKHIWPGYPNTTTFELQVWSSDLGKYVTVKSDPDKGKIESFCLRYHIDYPTTHLEVHR